MKIKTVVTVLLLVFVAASVVALVVKRTGDGPAAEGRDEAAAVKPAASGETVQGDVTRYAVYYFHGNARCKTCLTIEMYALEAIETGFPIALKENRLEFLPVNLDIAENEHFIDDFQLSARTVVIERITGGVRGEYLNLSRVWELVGDREAFISYVQDEAGKFMNGES